MRRVNYRANGTIVLLLCVFSALLGHATSMVPALEREITLSVKNEKTESVLKKIEEQSSVVFSYSSFLFSDSKTVSIDVKNKSIREVLFMILPRHIQFKAKNNYIILKESDVAKNQKTQKISGYVYDAQTDKKVPNVSVYDKVSLQSANTDEYGYYSITVPSKNTSVNVNRVNYKDTAISIGRNDSVSMTNIHIQPLSDSIAKNDSAAWQKKLLLLQNEAQRILKKWNHYFLELNIQDSIHREMQFSFLPFIGSNHRLSGNVYNKYSFNILGGYSRGTKALEIGGLFNLDRENVNGLQIAGLMNVVGDTMNGIQIGGLCNVIGKKTKGLQIGGLVNLNGGSFNGLQIGGLVNYNQKFESGMGIAGLVNYNQSAKGFHIAGLANLNDTSTKGMMLAGLINSSSFNADASAIAGCINYAASGNSQLQIAGLFNKTEHLSGTQIGVINISDTASGVPFGLFSYVKKGLHQLEVSADEVQYVNLNFRTGVPLFHNIFSFGIQPYQGSALWSIGYGLGSSLPIKGKLRTDVSLMMKHLSIGSFSELQSQRVQLYWGLEYNLHKHISLAFGPTVNLYMTSLADNYLSISPKYSRPVTFNNGVDGRYWLGAQVSLRFF